jgi:DNA-binding transcriptional regulator of glucitol operon
MKSKYLNRRAISLHLALVAWVAVCITAAWWQVGRAVGGNSLSFLYAIEWPCFAVLGFFGWYMLLNMEKVSEHQEKARREYEENMRAEAQAAREALAKTSPEDPQLAQYNDHLAKLSTAPKKKLWGH